MIRLSTYKFRIVKSICRNGKCRFANKKKEFDFFSIERTARLPCGRVVDDRRIQSNDILSLRNKMVPPDILQVLFELGTQGTVIEKSGVSVVNLGRRKDNSSSFAQGYDFFHVGDFLRCLLFFRSRGGNFFCRSRRQETGSSGCQWTTASEREGLCNILSAEKHHDGGCGKLHWGNFFFQTVVVQNSIVLAKPYF